MTREDALELFKKASDVAGNYLEYVEIVSMHNINIVLSEIFNDHEAQLKALYFQITELKMMEEDAQQFALRCSKELKAKDEEIERLKENIKRYEIKVYGKKRKVFDWLKDTKCY